MKKVTLLIAILIMLFFLVACGNHSNQNNPEINDTQQNEETIINAFKDDLQGHWVLKEDDYTYVVSFDFEYYNVLEGFYKSSAQEFQIKSLTIENHNTLVINAHYPGSDDPFDPIPAEDGTYRIFFTSTEKNQISLSYNNNEPVYFQYAGKTQEALAKECENDNESSGTGNNTTSNSNNSQSSVVGKWYASYVMYTSGGMKNLDDTYYTIELFSDGTGTENFLGEVRNFKWTLQKENDGLSGNIQFGTLTPAWLYYRGSNLIIDTGSSQTFFSKG